MNCFVFNSIRGDFELFVHMVQDIAEICSFDKELKELKWTGDDYTTIVFMGNFTNPFDKYSANDAIVTTDEAMKIQAKIMEFMMKLKEEAKKHHSEVVFLVGEEEVNNITYNNKQAYKMVQNPYKKEDMKMHFEFVEKHLAKVLENSSILIRWGPYYISTGGLSQKWLHEINVKNIHVLNLYWQYLVTERDIENMKKFIEPNSPTKFVYPIENPMLWRRQEKNEVVKIITKEQNFQLLPVFIHSIYPNQLLKSSLNFNMMEKNNVYFSNDELGHTDIINIENLSSNVFSNFVLKQDEHKPHVIKIEMQLSGNGTPINSQWEILEYERTKKIKKR